MGGVKVSGGKGHQDQGKVLKGRGAHFLTGIRPSWFTCSFSFVYLGRQAEGSCPGDGHLHPHTRQASPGLTLCAGRCSWRRSEPRCSWPA